MKRFLKCRAVENDGQNCAGQIKKRDAVGKMQRTEVIKGQRCTEQDAGMILSGIFLWACLNLLAFLLEGQRLSSSPAMYPH